MWVQVKVMISNIAFLMFSLQVVLQLSTLPNEHKCRVGELGNGHLPHESSPKHDLQPLTLIIH